MPKEEIEMVELSGYLRSEIESSGSY